MKTAFNKLAASIALLTVVGAPSPAFSEGLYDRSVMGKGTLAVANGIIFGRHGVNKGKLIAASAFNADVILYDPDTGEVVKEYGTEHGVIFPDDLAEGADGSLYITNLLGGTVVRIKQDGSHSVIADLGNDINAIAISEDGENHVCYQSDCARRRLPTRFE